MSKVDYLKPYIKSIPLIGWIATGLYRKVVGSTIYYRINYIMPGSSYWQYDYKSIKFNRLINKIISLIDRKGYAISISGNGSVYVILDNGVKFKWDPGDPYSLLGMPLRGDFEPECTYLISKLVKTGDIVIDIGANFGWYSVHFANLVGENGKVHVFEPTNIIEDLKENLILNGFDKRCIINQYALGNQDGTETLFIPQGLGTAFASLRKHTYKGVSKTSNLLVPIMKLDDYLDKNGVERVNLIKIDTEGAEFIILKGAEETLKRYSPVILLELQSYHTLTFGYTPIDAIKYLNVLGYDLYEPDPDHLGKVRKLSSFNDMYNYNFVAIHRDSLIDLCNNP
jgi:FkbM family methyltransferase